MRAKLICLLAIATLTATAWAGKRLSKADLQEAQLLGIEGDYAWYFYSDALKPILHQYSPCETKSSLHFREVNNGLCVYEVTASWAENLKDEFEKINEANSLRLPEKRRTTGQIQEELIKKYQAKCPASFELGLELSSPICVAKATCKQGYQLSPHNGECVSFSSCDKLGKGYKQVPGEGYFKENYCANCWLGGCPDATKGKDIEVCKVNMKNTDLPNCELPKGGSK